MDEEIKELLIEILHSGHLPEVYNLAILNILEKYDMPCDRNGNCE